MSKIGFKVGKSKGEGMKLRGESMNEVEKKEANLPAVPEEDLGLGFEDMEGQDFSFPFLVICDPKSPYLNPTHAMYIESAKQGKIINQQSNHVYDQVNVIPCKYAFRYVEWISRKQGGGFVASYHRGDEPKDVIIDALTGRTIVSANGHELMATSYYLCLLQEENWERVIIPMASTQLKKARKWNSVMQSLKQNGQPQPMFNKIYTLSVVSESNSKGSWYGWKVDFANDLTVIELDNNIYQMAKTVSATENFLPEQIIKSIAQSETESDKDVM